jgi:hypothetical protein
LIENGASADGTTLTASGARLCLERGTRDVRVLEVGRPLSSKFTLRRTLPDRGHRALGQGVDVDGVWDEVKSILMSPAAVLDVVVLVNSSLDPSTPVTRELHVLDVSFVDPESSNQIVDFVDYRSSGGTMALRYLVPPYPDVSRGTIRLQTCDGALGLPWACGMP